MNASVITDSFRQLVDRRLWPVAVLLLAALVAIPVLLAKGDSGSAAAPTAVAAVTGEAQPIVALTDQTQRQSRRRVLGSRKDPFRPAIKARPAKAAQAPADTGSTGAATGGPVELGNAGADPTGSTPSGGAPIVTGGTTPITAEPKKTFETYSLTVRFGESSGESLAKRNVKRLKALPNADKPVLIYLGLLEDRKTAVFLVDSSAEAAGDGKCFPQRSNCQTLHMKAGQTSFFDVTDEAGNVTQYQLDLVRVRVSQTTDETEARHSRHAVARGGRRALRSRVARVGRYRYDTASGTVQRLSTKAWKAQVARAAASK